MTNNKYTPTTEQVYRHQRNGALSYGEMLNCATPPPAWEPVHVLSEAELATTIRQAKAEALREAAVEIRAFYFGPDQVIPFSAGGNHKWGSDQAAKSLEARASRIEAGE